MGIQTRAGWCVGICMLGAGVEQRVGNNVRLFSFLYVAASHMAHVHYFSCVYIYKSIRTFC